MTAATEHRLEGLEPDNLLAWLALLGLLRTLATVVPDWRPRLHWAGLPVRPVLTLARPATQNEVAEAAARGCAELALVHEFGSATDLTFDRATARLWLEESITLEDARRSDLLDSLFSDGALKEDGKIMASPFCAMFGQGHQHFLTRLSEVPKGVLPKTLAKKKTAPDLNAPAKLAETLFSAWERADDTDGFRWDIEEDRRYALRFRDPSKEAGSTQHGANRLAALGLAVLPGTAVDRRRIRFLTLGANVDADGDTAISWPIWSRPASLAAVQALAAHPSLVASPLNAEDRARLHRLGVTEIRRAQRISVGKYFNFTRAETI